MKTRVIASTLVVVTIGSLLHFAWAWSGRSAVVAIFAAVNESVWEHLKMAFWPALGLSPIQRWIYGALPGWSVATAVRSLAPSILIVAIFYAYTAITGTHYLVADVATFIVAVLIGELLGHRVMRKRAGRGLRITAAAMLVLAVAAFVRFSFAPPDWFLFEDPTSGAHRER